MSNDFRRKIGESGLAQLIGFELPTPYYEILPYRDPV